MLTADEIAALQDAATELTQPIVDYLLEDIAQRIAAAGQFTATAQFEVWKLQELGLSQREIKKTLKKMLKVSNRELRQMLTQSAEAGYRFDMQAVPQKIPFDKNPWLQQVVSAAVKMAQDDLSNITQTIGMVDPYGKALPLQDAYRSCMDYAFMQVSTGATDYNTAIRQATRNLAEKGIRYIDYESGVHTSLEAAVRRNIMGGMGLMQEQISQHTHDEMDADGWEISAHSASAPDHEPIQGRQYTDAQYQALNNSLVRRIGTLNCAHAAHPIIVGVSIPQYTAQELEQLRADNEAGITYNGKHYTRYEAKERQRRLEASIRKQRRRILIDEATGDRQKLQADQIKGQLLKQEYARFSKAAGLRQQHDRMETVGYNWRQERAAEKAYIDIANKANSMYNMSSEAENIKAWQRDELIRQKIKSNPDGLVINEEKQVRHIKDSGGYIAGRSYITVDKEQLQIIVNSYAGTGKIQRDKHGVFTNKEIVTIDKQIGVSINPETGEETPTNRAYIHYSNTGTHVVPTVRNEE